MKKPTPLRPPSAVNLVAWLYENDPRPKIVPDWINSRHLIQVVLIEYRSPGRAEPIYEAFVASEEELLRELVRLRVDPWRRLVFQVSRESLEKLCPGCTAGCT